MDFNRFSEPSWSQVGIKIDRKSMQKNIQKMMANKKHLGGVLEPSRRSKRCPEARRAPKGLRREARPAANFRSLNEKSEREEGAKRA